MASDATVFVDYAGQPDVARMSVCGLSIAERVLRKAAQEGATRAVVRAEASALPVLPTLPLAVDVIAPSVSAPEPPAARSVPGNVIAGVEVTDEPSRRAATRALLQSCRRSYDGIGDKYVIRGVSLRLSHLWCRLGITPNQITIVNILVGLAACGVVLAGTYPAFAIAGALMFVQVVLDSCDGEVARLRFLSSKFGMWLDNVSDDVIDIGYTAMLGIAIGGIWAPLAIASAGLRSFCALMIHIDVARRGKPGDIMAFKWFFDTEGEDLAERFETSDASKPSVMSLVRAGGRRDFYCLVWAVTGLASVPVIGLVLGMAVGVGYFGLAVAHLLVTRRA